MNVIPSLFQGKEKKPNGFARPSSGTIKIKGKMKDASKLKKELNSLPVFSEVKEEDKKVKAMIVESTDRNKKPYLYISFSFSKNGAEAYFSIPPEVPNPSLRKLEVMKSVFTSLSMLEVKGVFVPDREDLYSKTMESFEIGSAFADMDSLRIKYRLERSAMENEKLKEELGKLKEEKEGLNHELLELEKRCQVLEDRLNRLESLTDNELDREIIKWVEDHYGKLNEEKFCDAFNVSGQRLEERLDVLSKKGVIKLV